MSQLTWDQDGKRYYETGVDRGVLYVMGENGYGEGVAWNGLTAVNESPSGAEPTALYADNIKYLNLMSAEDFAATIEAYTAPDEFNECDGTKEVISGLMLTQQPRKKFGFCYRTRIGNDEDGSDHAYKLHIVYGCLAAPASRDYATINDSPEAITLSWEISTTPATAPEGYKDTAHVIIDSRKFPADSSGPNAKLKALEDMLYGTNGSGSSATGTAPTLPTIAQIVTLLT